MAERAKKVLSPDDYNNYRNVRAVAFLYIVLGSILVLGGIGLAFDRRPRPEGEIHPAIAIGIALAGLCGAIGGIGALRGNRRWAPLVYAMAVLYLGAFPLGTILSLVMLLGLHRYLASVERVALAGKKDADSDQGKPNTPL